MTRHPRHLAPPPASQPGYSLIEVLVTLAILTIALLGLASLQAQGLHFNTSAYSRTQASLLASDIIERMRLSPANAAAYDTAGFVPDPGDGCRVTSTPDPDNDRHCWYRRVRQALPGGDAAIDVDGTGTVTVRVSWRERPSGRRRPGFDPADLSREELNELRGQQVSVRVFP